MRQMRFISRQAVGISAFAASMQTIWPTLFTLRHQIHSRKVGKILEITLLALAPILLGECVLPATAQQISASIVGTIQDPQGHVVVGAAVKATNLGTGDVHATATNGDGIYVLQHLPVGKYSFSVDSQGFKHFTQNNIVLGVEQTLTLNVALEVGAQTQSVVVTTAPTLVNTSTAEIGQTVQPEEIIGLPLVNRDVYSEISLTPGVQSNSGSDMSSSTPNMPAGQPPSEDVVVNGSIDAAVPMVSYYLDGGQNMTGVRNYGNQIPNPDAIEEFRVITSGFSAEYGRMGAAVVTAVTKSGTNEFHGSLFEFVRNTALNAAPWNSKLNAPYHRNNFGGVVGGPIVRNKAFFFFSYGGLRQTLGQFLNNAVVPSAQERQGNFSDAAVLPIDQATGKVYDYNGVPGWIPPSDLDPTAQNIIKTYIALPNSPNNVWKGFYSIPLTDNEYLGKYDQVISSSDHISAEYFTIGDAITSLGGGNLVYSLNAVTSRQQNAIVNEVHTFNVTTANQVWATFTSAIDDRVNLPKVSLHDLGSAFTPQGPPALPTINVSGYFNAASGVSGSPIGDDYYSIRDAVNTIKGKHSLTLGGEVSLDHIMTVGNNQNFGNFVFQTSAPNSSKNALADFLLGHPASMEQDSPWSSLLSTFHYGLFLQDDYKMTPNITLNLGLRYDIDTPPVDTQNETQTFVPNVQSVVSPAAPLGLLYPGDKGVGRGPISTRLHHISPRVGIVWDPFGDGKTAIRAGAGVYYGSVSGNNWNQPNNALPFAIRQTFLDIASLTNVYGDPSSFPNGDPYPYIYSPSHPRFLPDANVETIGLGYQWPYTYQLNAAVQREIPGNTSVTVAYVGSLSHDIPFTTDPNYPAYAPGATDAQSNVEGRRPYNDNGALGQVAYLESTQTTSYHSLQITAEKRMSHDFMLRGFYVFSKTFLSASVSAVGLGSETQDFDALYEERGPSDFDQRHMASMSGIWDLNYYRGSNRLLNHLSNGWQITSIVSLHSGLPVNMVTGADNNASGGEGANRPNLVPGQKAFLDPHRGRTIAAARWFNTAAFVANHPGTGIGPYGADGNTPRDYLRAPGFRDIDVGLFRTFQLPEKCNLELRGEATNAFNLVNLNAPTANLSSPLDGRITSANTSREIQIGARLTF